MIKAIIFDCWGTLFTNSQSLHPFERFAHTVGRTMADQLFVKPFERHVMQDSHEDLRVPIRQLLDELQISYTAETVQKLEAILLGSISDQIAYPDTLEALTQLRKSYRLILLTNTFKQAYEGLNQKFHIDTLFDDVITSFGSHQTKPDSQLFQDAVTAAQCEAGEILMIGDNLLDDIEPALGLGMKTLLLDRKERHLEYTNRAPNLDGIEAYARSL
jgi:2-haloalkanoic acid dehalogenase type II